METKKCSFCGVEKPVTEFFASSHNRDGYQCYCKECSRELSRERRARKKASGEKPVPMPEEAKGEVLTVDEARERFVEKKAPVKKIEKVIIEGRSLGEGVGRPFPC